MTESIESISEVTLVHLCEKIKNMKFGLQTNRNRSCNLYNPSNVFNTTKEAFASQNVPVVADTAIAVKFKKNNNATSTTSMGKKRILLSIILSRLMN